jgi:hypothetical protein
MLPSQISEINPGDIAGGEQEIVLSEISLDRDRTKPISEDVVQFNGSPMEGGSYHAVSAGSQLLVWSGRDPACPMDVSPFVTLSLHVSISGAFFNCGCAMSRESSANEGESAFFLVAGHLEGQRSVALLDVDGLLTWCDFQVEKLVLRESPSMENGPVQLEQHLKDLRERQRGEFSLKF